MGTLLANWWVFFSALAFLFAIVNLVRAVLGRSKGWELLTFFSLSSGLLAVVAEYQMISSWAFAGDWSAIEDVAPHMGDVLLWAVIAGILLNGIALYLHRKE